MKRVLIILLIIPLFLTVLIFFADSSPYAITEDPEGVPIVDYGWLMGRHVGKQRYPVTISSRAEEHYLRYKETGEEEHLEKFYNNLEWLIENRRETEEFIVFPSYFEYPYYGCEKGWVSAMAQGFVLKDLTYAFELTRDEKYINLAEGVLNSFKVEIKDGGVLYVDPEDGGTWYAEYTCNDPPRVLNGFWYALDGIHYYYQATGDEEAKALYISGVAEVISHLHEFDTGEWTYYDLEGYPSDETYHSLHIEIMEKLYKQTGEKVFFEYGERWKSYNFSRPRFNNMVLKNLFHKI
jgi:hypothetical protein